ncbi:MAG: B12-binding domain-containing protein [Tagaea sp.]
MSDQEPIGAVSQESEDPQGAAAGRSLRGTMRRQAVQRRRLDAIAGLLESEVVPRLVREYRARAPEATRDSPAAFAQADIDAFACATLAPHEDAALDCVERALARGIPVERIYLDLLAPAARRLGAGWEDDSLDFTQVMTGLTRLHLTLHALSARFAPPDPDRGARSILLAPNPGDEHVFGALMLTEFFRRAGWATRCELQAGGDDLADLIREGRFDAVALSCASDRLANGIERTIAGLRRAGGQRLTVLVGGRLFADRPELAHAVGADATAADGPGAVARAGELVPANIRAA